MAGEIKHSWTGTVLTITSDSGTSSCDLKGKKGDRGVRGAQGRSGVILNADGTVDMSGYATESYVEDLLANFEGGTAEVDLSNYYTRAEIDATIAELELSGGGGGSGGGSTNNATLTLTNENDWLTTTIASDNVCNITASWSSTENGISTGAGMLTIMVDGIVKYTATVSQGRFTVNISPYVSSGTNSVRVSVSDAYGNTRSIIYTVNVVSLLLKSTFDSTLAYEGTISYTYVPTASLTKTVHFILDGTQIGTATVTTSGRQQTFNIPAQSHGSHTFEVYFTAEINDVIVESNHLYYDLICIESGNTTPIISSAFNKKEMKQFETINIPYYVYNPTSLTSDVVLKANSEVINELTVDRTEQIWGYRADEFGSITLSISCGDTVKSFDITVSESEIEAEAVTDNLELYLTSYGRSNNESTPNIWNYGDIACFFTGYNWKSDGWLMDDDGITVHRVSGDARLTIPLKVFKDDFRTTGKTIEFEFATRDIKNYDAVIVSCMSDNVGFQMTAQEAILKSEQSKLSTQYKEDEHIRLTFVVEKKAENRLIYIFLNGIMCGATQYPTDDNFSQGTPVNISIGSSYCTIDLYNIRVYNNNLTRYQVLDNWIADTQDIEEKIKRYTRNNIYDAYGNIVISQLPNDLPYLVLEAPVLPQYKGNKLNVNGSYVNPVDTSKNFTFKNAQADVQGTSSAGYARKNYKLKFKNGITQGNQQLTAYQMRDDSIPTSTFTFKADVASSEGCNNVELVRLYDNINPYRTPPQLEDSSIRQGIDGFPIVIFHNDGNTTTFIGKYNFNNDKGTPEVFGFTNGDESWEILNNTSDRVIWKNADFSGTDWQNDFEARYPEDNTDTTNLANFAEWVVSTDREQATSEALAEPVTYDGVEYTADTADYRLAKFKAEIENYAELDSALFYYLFTELFLMVDSRAKNAFPTLIGGSKICWLPYDMDTANGTNNEGDLVFGYELEDIDKTETGADVYNGQKSVFWNNLRDCFKTELQTMYQELRSTGGLNYDVIENAYEEHQAKWCEAIWNEDAYYKYLEPLIKDGSGIYLPMLQGSKSEQRKWWLYNRFRYIDSKYVAGDSLSDFITLRGYAKSDITLEPYADIYASIKYGSYMVQKRALRNKQHTLECPLDNVNDTEIYIYSASQLRDIGDISGLKVGLADFSMATRLQNLKIGDSSADYDNSNLMSLTLGNNVLLNTLDVRNCSKLGTGEQQSIDVSGCTNIEHIYLEGTALKSVTLPNAGILKTLHLPDTTTNLKLVNQTALTDFVISDYSNISTLRIENTPRVNNLEAFLGMKENGRVRITNIDWTFDSYNECVSVLNKIDTMRGLDENDNNTDKAQISGIIRVPWKCAEYISTWESTYPTINFEVAEFVLNDASWAEINEISNSSWASELLSVGDEKTVTLSNGEVITVVIYGFNHDNLSDGTGTAGITFGMKECLSNTMAWETNGSYSNYRAYSKSSIRDTLINTYLPMLPTDLQELIKPVKKYSYYKEYYNSSAITDSVDDKLFLFSMNEILGTTKQLTTSTGNLASASSQEKQYEYFKNAPIPEGFNALSGNSGTFYPSVLNIGYNNRLNNIVNVGSSYYFNYNAAKALGNDGTTSIGFWTRSGVTLPESGYTGSVYIQNVASYTSNNNTAGVSFGFCI
jgi:hypothetical protein